MCYFEKKKQLRNIKRSEDFSQYTFLTREEMFITLVMQVFSCTLYPKRSPQMFPRGLGMWCHGVFFWGSQDPYSEHSPTCKPFPPCLRSPDLLCYFSSTCSALVIFPSAIFFPGSWGRSAKVFPILACPCRIKKKDQSSSFILDFRSSVCTYQMSTRKKVLSKENSKMRDSM